MNFKKYLFLFFIVSIFLLPQIISAACYNPSWIACGKTLNVDNSWSYCGNCPSGMSCYELGCGPGCNNIPDYCSGKVTDFNNSGGHCRTDCTSTCEWECGNWAGCVNNRQTRNCWNICGRTTGKPSESQTCDSSRPPVCNSVWSNGQWSKCANAIEQDCSKKLDDDYLKCHNACFNPNTQKYDQTCLVKCRPINDDTTKKNQCGRTNCSNGSGGKGTQTRTITDLAGCSAPKYESKECTVKPEDCCVPTKCSKDDACTSQEGAPDGCGGTCPRVDPSKVKMVDIVINPEYVKQMEKENFFTPYIEDLNPLDDIDCILKGEKDTNKSFNGKIVLNTGLVLAEGTLTYDPSRGAHVWKLSGMRKHLNDSMDSIIRRQIDGDNSIWSAKLYDDLSIINSTSSRSISCKVEATCNGDQEGGNRPVSSCLHIWGGEKANRKSDVNVYKIALLGGKNTVGSRYIIKESYLQDRMKEIFPFSAYTGQFEYYVDIKQMFDDNIIFSADGRLRSAGKFYYSECTDITNYILQTKRVKADYSYAFANAGNTYIAGDIPIDGTELSYVFMHEIGHWFKLNDEYRYPDQDRVKNWTPGKNCDSERFCAKFKQLWPVWAKTNKCYGGCTRDVWGRTTADSMMKDEIKSRKFNAVGCAIILQNMYQDGFPIGNAYDYCAKSGGVILK